MAKRQFLKKGGASLVKLLLLCAAVIGFCFFVQEELETYRTTLRNKEQIAQLAAQQQAIELTTREKQAMQQSIASGKQADEELLRILRAKGYVYSDEVVYYDMKRVAED